MVTLLAVCCAYTLSSREVKHENEAVKLSMKQEESCGLHSSR